MAAAERPPGRRRRKERLYQLFGEIASATANPRRLALRPALNLLKRPGVAVRVFLTAGGVLVLPGHTSQPVAVDKRARAATLKDVQQPVAPLETEEAGANRCAVR